MHCTVPHCTMLACTVLYCTVFEFTILYCVVLFIIRLYGVCDGVLGEDSKIIDLVRKKVKSLMQMKVNQCCFACYVCLSTLCLCVCLCVCVCV